MSEPSGQAQEGVDKAVTGSVLLFKNPPVAVGWVAGHGGRGGEAVWRLA